jgi:hypothetical protein
MCFDVSHDFNVLGVLTDLGVSQAKLLLVVLQTVNCGGLHAPGLVTNYNHDASMER